MASDKHAFLAVPFAVLFLWLACALPSLEKTRLQDVDELTHARVAQAAALRGQWWPLELDGHIFVEKPPLLLWMAAATAELSGQPYASWPYRLWTCLGAGLALFCLALIGVILDRLVLGISAALALALQGDLIFHARFFTFDTLFLGCALLGLALSLRAARSLKTRDAWLAGIALALAAAFKSWFVLALVPAFAASLMLALPSKVRRAWALALGLPALLVLLGWTALYVRWVGRSFLSEEWSVNLMGRALGRANELDPQGHASFYLKWAARSAPALLPLGLAVPLGLAPGLRGQSMAQEPGQRAWAFARIWTWSFCLSWFLGLALVRAETINYLLPLEAGLCLALGLELASGQSRARRLLQAGLLGAAIVSSLRLWDPLWSLFLGLALGLPWCLVRHWEGDPDPVHAGAARNAFLPWVAVVLLGIGLVGLLAREAAGLLQRPLDPTRQVADLLLAHPARVPGEVLWVIGGSTQAIDFYSSYQLRWLPALPAHRPLQATLVETRAGWIFYPAVDAEPRPRA
ncbi:MAG TPA: glycosyltransferase family 39 protein [bacterium]|jgi:4-amino-4-deoxy-L-arabinose transferase-like glycosyltransferase|nr:glycosyltransferase family 39 protein [bacterium]